MRIAIAALVGSIACAPVATPPLSNVTTVTAAPDRDGPPYIGDPQRARVVIVSYFNYRCPHCIEFEPQLETIAERHGDQIVIYYKVLRLRAFADADDGAVAAFAAHRQGKFIEMHRAILAAQRFTPEALRDHARAVGLDLARFDRDVADPRLRARIDRDYAEAEATGVDHVPWLSIDGVMYEGPLAAEPVARAIASALEREAR